MTTETAKAFESWRKPMTTETTKTFEIPTVERPMSDDLINDILGVSTKAMTFVDVPLPEPEGEPVAEEAATPEGYTELTEDGVTMVAKPFADVFGWEPKAPHLVKTYNYDVPAPMEGYILDKPMIENFSLCESLGLKQNVTGPTGCGKTQLVEWYAAKTGRPYMRIAHTESFDKVEIFGQCQITDGDTNFELGVLPRTFSKAYMVLGDEITRTPAGPLMTYGTLLDRRELILPEMKDAGIEPLKPVEGWSFVAADNTKGNGDGMDKYIASNVQDSAFLNRFDIVHDMDYLSVADETAMLEGLGLTAANAAKLAGVSDLLHKGNKAGTLTCDFSPRNLQAIAKLVVAGLKMDQAFKMNYLSRVTEAEQTDVRETYRAVTGVVLS